MKNSIWKFLWDCGRMGKLYGTFVATEEEVESAIGKEVDFGEVLGKHSEISGILEHSDLEKVTDNPEFVAEFQNLCLGCGYNPLRALKEEEEGEE